MRWRDSISGSTLEYALASIAAAEGLVLHAESRASSSTSRVPSDATPSLPNRQPVCFVLGVLQSGNWANRAVRYLQRNTIFEACELFLLC